MKHFVDICGIGDVANGRHKCVVVDGQPILVFNLNGVFHALRNRCTHLDFPLEGGRQLGWEIICRQHGARFDIRDGRVLGGPAIDPVTTFETQVRDGRVGLLMSVASSARDG